MPTDHIVASIGPTRIERYIAIAKLRPESGKLDICSIIMMDNSIDLILFRIMSECEVESTRSLFVFVGRLSQGLSQWCVGVETRSI